MKKNAQNALNQLSEPEHTQSCNNEQPESIVDNDSEKDVGGYLNSNPLVRTL